MKLYKSITLLLVFSIFSTISFAKPDEGMWLPMFIKKYNESHIKKLGAKLTAEDIYNINQASIKDAIVSFGGFCTGEIVSNKGLVFTNHHCGYDAIASLSKPGQNHLDSGFWAKSFEEELPAEGLFVRILVKMEDVTSLITNAKTSFGNTQEGRVAFSNFVDSVQKAAVQGTHYEAEVESYFAGNEYYLLVFERFTDIRLVGTPPAMIGKFGGDTDNWMWPRHTGDFSVFRIYAGKDNKPAEYSTENIPYQPKYSLKISLDGVEKGDFNFIMGYPGSTERYLTSYDIDHKYKYSSPNMIKGFNSVLEPMKAEMKKSEALKLKYASTYASTSNAYKYFIGQQRQLSTYGLPEIKKKDEDKFMEWVNSSATHKEYADILGKIETANRGLESIEPEYSTIRTSLFRSASFLHSYYHSPLNTLYNQKKAKKKQVRQIAERIQSNTVNYFNETDFESEKNIYKSILNNLAAIGDSLPVYFTEAKELFGNTSNSNQELINQYVDYIFDNSFLYKQETYNEFMKKPKKKVFLNDPAIKFLNSSYKYYTTQLAPKAGIANKEINENRTLYIKALREMYPDSAFYPDANSTLRFTYGTVEPYYPEDGLFYNYYTTHHGILEKHIEGDDEFDVPTRQLSLLKKKDFGRYSTNDTLNVCFITTTDITGGNSGSPVIDGEGKLIGIAFDGNWESMIGDIYVDPALNRTIAVDIRYVLWVIDKMSNAARLIEELTIE